MSLVNRPRDGSERPIFFRQRACLSGISQQRLVRGPLRRVWRRHHECVNFPCSHTHRLKSLIFLCTLHTRTASSLILWTPQSHVLCKWQHRWQSNYICGKNSIELRKKKFVYACVLSKSVAPPSSCFILKHTQQTAPARPLFFPAPHKFFFLFLIHENWNLVFLLANFHIKFTKFIFVNFIVGTDFFFSV